MSASCHVRDSCGACTACLRRSWLLSALSGPLDCCARDRERLQALLGLGDLELLQAAGGRRRAQLRAQYDSFKPQMPRLDDEVETLCRHDSAYPRALAGPDAAHMLNVLGGARRLVAMSCAPMVAIVGSRTPSDYGREMARSIAHGLAVGGVSVVAAWHEGIAMAAHDGALRAGGATVAIMGGGLDVACATRHRALLRRLTGVGCAVSELPCDCPGRRWGALAGERTIAALASVTVVVEAEQTAGDLAVARLAHARARTVAAIPGRVTSLLSRGTNALLMEGAPMVRDAADVFELLYETDPSRTAARAPKPVAHAPLQARLRSLLERVGVGHDTPDSLVREGVGLGEALVGLSELELMGLLRRGDGGRYVPTRPARQTERP
jgi:DNA processing protein